MNVIVAGPFQNRRAQTVDDGLRAIARSDISARQRTPQTEKLPKRSSLWPLLQFVAAKQLFRFYTVEPSCSLQLPSGTQTCTLRADSEMAEGTGPQDSRPYAKSLNDSQHFIRRYCCGSSCRCRKSLCVSSSNQEGCSNFRAQCQRPLRRHQPHHPLQPLVSGKYSPFLFVRTFWDEANEGIVLPII